MRQRCNVIAVGIYGNNADPRSLPSKSKDSPELDQAACNQSEACEITQKPRASAWLVVRVKGESSHKSHVRRDAPPLSPACDDICNLLPARLTAALPIFMCQNARGVIISFHDTRPLHIALKVNTPPECQASWRPSQSHAAGATSTTRFAPQSSSTGSLRLRASVANSKMSSSH